MEPLSDHVFLLNNFVVWAIFLVAIVAYGLLIEFCFMARANEQWYQRTENWLGSLKTMLATLPLLGLLGTISGLLKTFLNIASDKSFSLQEVISGGIAEAMFTTQMGLVMVVPGLLMLAYLNSRRKKWKLLYEHA
ncbi:MotA/TolQ/ExbB proton channel family protein [Teredinibacter purpureus]|uniref:MotA/TolQ/ExbB proton channel family protein n=1 Tax=Teredinibacter purpureus TaxID=2731756 RepID=UPI0005F87B8E|nr:MotA/TolQ/ExbB proton channel family protein [Teredinibacter purpureus]